MYADEVTSTTAAATTGDAATTLAETSGSTSSSGALECEPGMLRMCYDGPPATVDVGLCRAGTATCVDGLWGPCDGQVLPAKEDCATEEDDDCDGEPAAGCTDECDPGTQDACYSGPPGTEDVGQCKAGITTCVDGTWSACEGEVVPTAEDCANPGFDDDCDLVADESCPKCMMGAMKPCYGGPEGTEGVGACKAGVATCTIDGQYGVCEGQVVPGVEDCDSPFDEDCDGLADC